MQTLDEIVPKLDKDSFTIATAVFNVDKNRYTDKIPCTCEAVAGYRVSEIIDKMFLT